MNVPYIHAHPALTGKVWYGMVKAYSLGGMSCISCKVEDIAWLWIQNELKVGQIKFIFAIIYFI